MNLVENDSIDALEFGTDLFAYVHLGSQADYRTSNFGLLALAYRCEYVSRIACVQASDYDQNLTTRMALDVPTKRTILKLKT